MKAARDKNIYQPKKIRNTREVVFVIAVFPHTSTLLKMLMSDPCHQPGILGSH
jgi:hypothetical protein